MEYEIVYYCSQDQAIHRLKRNRDSISLVHGAQTGWHTDSIRFESWHAPDRPRRRVNRRKIRKIERRGGL